MFEKNLLTLKNDLKYHHRNKEYLIKFFIQKRLNASLSSYFKNLESSVYALTVANPEKVIKEMKWSKNY